MPVIPGLGWTFNTQAERYQRRRPGYVPELYEEIFRRVPLDETSTAVEERPSPMREAGTAKKFVRVWSGRRGVTLWLIRARRVRFAFIKKPPMCCFGGEKNSLYP